jgi:DNA-binding MarR family transcriptional regulator
LDILSTFHILASKIVTDAIIVKVVASPTDEAATDLESQNPDPFPDERLAPTAALLHAHLAVDAAINARAAEPLGLEPAIADLLVRLSKADDHRLRGVDIGRQLLANPARVSRLIDRAEAQGLVTRLPDPADRRAQQITLTEAGCETASAFAPRLLAVLDEVIHDTLTAKERATLVALLDRIRHAATEATPRR